MKANRRRHSGHLISASVPGYHPRWLEFAVGALRDPGPLREARPAGEGHCPGRRGTGSAHPSGAGLGLCAPGIRWPEARARFERAVSQACDSVSQSLSLLGCKMRRVSHAHIRRTQGGDGQNAVPGVAGIYIVGA